MQYSYPGTPIQTIQLEEEKRERRRRQARERMARHRAAIKNMPPDVQTDILERARASRAKYRAQHRFQLIMKERCRRENKSRENQTLDEFIRRRRLRESKLGASAKQREIQRCQSPMEADELTE